MRATRPRLPVLLVHRTFPFLALQADFSSMETLDSDDAKLRCPSSGRVMERDIVQFVPFSVTAGAGGPCAHACTRTAHHRTAPRRSLPPRVPRGAAAHADEYR